MISILIINFNDGKYIKNCLEAIGGLNYKDYEKRNDKKPAI